MFKTRHLMIAMGAVSLPIAYLIKQHVDWMQSPESKGRMLTQMLTFWLSWIPGILVFHHAFRLPKTLPNRTLKQALMAGSAALIPIFGFKGGIELAKMLYPHKQPRPANGVPFSDILPPRSVLLPPIQPRLVLPQFPVYAFSAYGRNPAGFGRASGV